MLDDIVFLHCAHTLECTASVDKRFDYHTIQYKTAGDVELWYDDERMLLSGAYLWPAFPGHHIRFRRAPEVPHWNHRYAAFTGSGVHRLFDPADVLARPLSVPADEAGRVARIFDSLIAAARRQDELRRIKAIALLQQLLVEAAEIGEERPTADRAWLGRVLAMIDICDPHPNYEAVAQRLGVSLPTLRRRFASATGMPLHEHYIRSRITEARRLLGESTLAIKEVAAHLGYSDVFHFTRQFSQKAGVSPGVYRASVQADRRRRAPPPPGSG